MFSKRFPLLKFPCLCFAIAEKVVTSGSKEQARNTRQGEEDERGKAQKRRRQKGQRESVGEGETRGVLDAVCKDRSLEEFLLREITKFERILKEEPRISRCLWKSLSSHYCISFFKIFDFDLLYRLNGVTAQKKHAHRVLLVRFHSSHTLQVHVPFCAIL